MARRVRGPERREEMLAATVALVSERGHQAVRISDVAQRLSVSTGLIIYHFRTKEELLAAAFASAAQSDLAVARNIVGREEAPLRCLLAIVDWYLPSASSSPSWRLWIDGWAASQFNASLAEVVRGMAGAWHGMFADALSECAAAGVASVDDPADDAAQLVAYLNGLAVMTVTATEPREAAQLAVWVRQYIAEKFAIAADTLGA